MSCRACDPDYLLKIILWLPPLLPTISTVKATFPTNTTSVLLLDASPHSGREKVLTGASGIFTGLILLIGLLMVWSYIQAASEKVIVTCLAPTLGSGTLIKRKTRPIGNVNFVLMIKFPDVVADLLSGQLLWPLSVWPNKKLLCSCSLKLSRWPILLYSY